MGCHLPKPGVIHEKTESVFSAVLADIDPPRRFLGDTTPISHPHLVVICHIYYQPPFGTAQSYLRRGVRAYEHSWCVFLPDLGVVSPVCGALQAQRSVQLAANSFSVPWLLNASVIWGLVSPETRRDQ